MPQIDLQAYWGPTSFNLDCEDLKKLRAYLASGNTSVVVIGAWSFQSQNGYLYYASGGNPWKYYIDMTANAIIAVIDKVVIEYC